MINVETIKQLEEGLRDILDTLYDSSNLMTFDELANAYSKLLPTNFEVLFYIRAKARFGINNNEYKFLKFSYMSFYYKDGSWDKLDMKLDQKNKSIIQDSLTSEEAALIDKGFIQNETDNFSIFYHKFEDINLERIVNLTKRIFISFYKNCGGYDHVKESTSARYIKEYYNNYDFREIDNLIIFCKKELDLNVVIGNHNEKTFFTNESEYAELIDTLKGDKGKVTSLLGTDKFKRDLRTSISKKSQTFGIDDKGKHYVIRTFSNNYFAKEVEDLDTTKELDELNKIYKSQQKSLGIFTANRENICLESVYYANNLINNVLTTLEEYIRENLIHELNKKCLVLEETTSENPVKTHEELNEILVNLFSEYLNKVKTFTLANNICIRFLEPINDELYLLVFTKNEKRQSPLPSVLAGDIKGSISAQALYTSKGSIYLNSEIIRKKIERYKSINDEDKLKKSEMELIERENLLDSFGSKKSAVYAISIKVGNICWGTCEFSSDVASQLSSDVAFFNHLGSAFGDCIRRVSLANDRGWLTKMSFIHAARHKIEAIIRDIEASDKILAKELQGLFEQRAALHSYSKDSKNSDFLQKGISQLESIIRAKWSPEVNTAFKSKVSNLDKYLSHNLIVILIDIFDTLISNEQHGKIEPNSLVIKIIENDIGKESIHIYYLPENSYVSVDKAKQIFLSPIADDKTNTYHYGLFLLAAQVRMIGGQVSAKSENLSGMGSGLFGLSFILPLKS